MCGTTELEEKVDVVVDLMYLEMPRASLVVGPRRLEAL